MARSLSEREAERIEFIKRVGWGTAEVKALPVDASARCYFRLTLNGDARILMDAPPGIAEPVEVFAKVGRHLLACGISTPIIYEEDIEHGFLLLEDFGENTYARLLAAGEDEEKLYELAVDVLIAMHSSVDVPNIAMPPYDLAFLMKEVLIMFDWYLPLIEGRSLSARARQSYVSAWCEVFETLPKQPKALVLRDFHIDNLMILSGREGVKSCGLLDFQTALLGVAPYDLMSLVEDARRDIEPQFRQKMIGRYLKGRGIEGSSWEADEFMAWYSVLSAQRHAKVLGLFARLFVRDNKSAYLVHLPRVTSLMSASLAHPSLKPVMNWFEEHFPGFAKPLDESSVVQEMVVEMATLSEGHASHLSSEE